jgi:ribosomal protein S28E/S33
MQNILQVKRNFSNGRNQKLIIMLNNFGKVQFGRSIRIGDLGRGHSSHFFIMTTTET